MKNNKPNTVDPDDYFAHTRMGFGDHIEELRFHLIRAIAGFCVGMVASFFIGGWILNFIAQPVETALKGTYERRFERIKKEMMDSSEFKEMLKPKEREILVKFPGQDGQLSKAWTKMIILEDPKDSVPLMEYMAKQLGPQPSLKVFRVEEGFMVWLRVCVMTGLVLSSPWVFYQVWAFIAAGLYPHEKKLVNFYLPFSVLLFISGVIFAFFVVLPQAVDYLLMFNEWLGFEPELRLSEWLGFAIMVPVVFGVAFQTPLAMLMLFKVGLVSIESYRKFRRFAIFGLTIVAALLAPGDMISMIIMVGCMVVFYELGIILCQFMPGKPLLDLDVPESEEMVEV